MFCVSLLSVAKIPKWNSVASGITRLRFVEIVSSPKKPRGMYFLLSEDALGMIIKDLGLYVSRKTVGVSASFRVPASELFNLISRTFSILCMTNGIFLNSAGLTPTSHKHHRFWLLINSLAPTNLLIYCLAFGSFCRNSSNSESSIIKFPPSVGWHPFVITGTLQRGFFLLSMKIVGASIR